MDTPPEPNGEYPQCKFDEHGIAWVDYGDISHVTSSHILAVYRWFVKHEAHMPTAVLCIANDARSMTLPAFALLEKPPMSDLILCSTTVLDSKLLRFLSRIYLPLHRPPYPVRFTANVEEAVAWSLKTREEILVKRQG